MTRHPRGRTKQLILTTFADHPDWSSRQLALYLNLSRGLVRSTVSRAGQHFAVRSQYPPRVRRCIVPEEPNATLRVECHQQSADA